MSFCYNTKLNSVEAATQQDSNSQAQKLRLKDFRFNRSFARRIGKHLSNSQIEYLTNYLPNKKLDIDNPLSKACNIEKIFLEIGFGMGEHLINQARNNPTYHYIGCEPYINGVANILKLAAEGSIGNISLWPDSIDLIIDNLPFQSLDGIYILFPDPWPKQKQHKRRLVNKERMDLLLSKLKKEGILYFASDIYSYVEQVKDLMIKEFNFKLLNIDEFEAHPNYIQTKYHSKATLNSIKPKFLKFSKE